MDKLVVDARIKDPGMQAPLPGYSFIISIMRYDVLRVVKGAYPYNEVFVGHEIADLSLPQFNVGAQHRLTLSREFPKYASVLNPFEKETLEKGTFFCISYELMM
jgi:hypothetical protein